MDPNRLPQPQQRYIVTVLDFIVVLRRTTTPGGPLDITAGGRKRQSVGLNRASIHECHAESRWIFLFLIGTT